MQLVGQYPIIRLLQGIKMKIKKIIVVTVLKHITHFEEFSQLSSPLNVKWVLGRPWRAADHSPPSSAAVMEE